MKYEKMNDVTKDALRITEGMIAVFPYGDKCQIRVQENLPKFNGSFGANNSTVVFFWENEMYVMPYIRKAFDVISKNLKRDYIYVPFSNGDYPEAYQEKWKQLRLKAKKYAEEDFLEDCQEQAKKIGLRQLPEDVLTRCYKIPNEGIMVRRFNYIEITSPAINSRNFDCIAAERIGKFCTNNGRVVFVNSDGSTYVAKGYKVTEILKEYGFTESGLFVPFSNCEVIENPVERAVWESKPKF